MQENTFKNWKSELLKTLKLKSEQDLEAYFQVYKDRGISAGTLIEKAPVYHLRSFPCEMKFIRLHSSQGELDEQGGVSNSFGIEEGICKNILIKNATQKIWGNEGYLDVISFLESIQMNTDDADFKSKLANFVPLVNTSLVEHAGGSVIDEIVTAMRVLFEFKHRGELHILFSHDPQSFLQVAKLRAARKIFENLPEIKFKLISQSSARFHTNYEKSSNMLRNVATCTAAMWGGADFVALKNFREGEYRQSRNTFHVLEQESHLKKVRDPAKGSVLIDHLTDFIVKEALKQYNLVEDTPLTKFLSDQAKRCQQGAEQQRNRFECGENCLVGLNQYPDPSEVCDHLESYDQTEMFPVRRPQQRLEELRSRLHEVDLKVTIYSVGKLSDVYPRVNFAQNLFEITGKQIKHIHLKDDTRMTLNEDAHALVICALDDELPPLLASLVLPKNIPVFLVSRKVNHPQLINVYQGMNLFELLHKYFGRLAA